MKRLIRMASLLAIVTLASLKPVFAQIVNGLTFTTSFPFYVGNTKMPVGSYKVTQSSMDEAILLIESTDGNHSAFIDFTPTHSNVSHTQSDATFHKYGDVEYLNRVWVGGQKYGMKVEPTKAEQKLAAKGAPSEHSVPGN